MRNAGLEESQGGIKMAGRNINNLRYEDDTTCMAESKEELKSLLMKVRGEWKSWLKAQHSENEDHGIWSHHFMANRWKTVETVADFIFLGSKITADGDCSYEVKKHLPLWKKVMSNIDSILKSRDIALPTKVQLVKAMVFPVVMYRCESWTIKKTECRKIDAFVLWCWRRLLRIPWTARISDQSILKEISPEYSLEG